MFDMGFAKYFVLFHGIVLEFTSEKNAIQLYKMGFTQVLQYDRRPI